MSILQDTEGQHALYKCPRYLQLEINSPGGPEKKKQSFPGKGRGMKCNQLTIYCACN